MKYKSDIVEYFANHYREYLKFALTVTHNLEGAQDMMQNAALKFPLFLFLGKV